MGRNRRTIVAAIRTIAAIGFLTSTGDFRKIQKVLVSTLRVALGNVLKK
jgi:hypothetical protein